MNRLGSRVRRLERRMPDPTRPRVIRFPTEGMTDKEIEQELVRRRGRRRLTEDDFCRMHGVELADR